MPAGYVAVVRDLEVLTYSGAAETAQFFVRIPGPLAITFAWLNCPATIEGVQWQGRVVANAGDILQASVSTADNQLVVSGYLLSSP